MLQQPHVVLSECESGVTNNDAQMLAIKVGEGHSNRVDRMKSHWGSRSVRQSGSKHLFTVHDCGTLRVLKKWVLDSCYAYFYCF